SGARRSVNRNIKAHSISLFFLFFRSPIFLPDVSFQFPSDRTLVFRPLHAVVQNCSAHAAAYAVDHATCRLNPPVSASTSSTSPMKYRFFTFLDSIVPGFTSFTETPP